MDSEGEKLDSLSDRIRKAEAGRTRLINQPIQRPQRQAVGLDLILSALLPVPVFLGRFWDHAFGTSPWCLVGMIVVGFSIGIMSAWRAMQK